MMDETHVYLIAHLAPDGRFVGPVKVGFSRTPEKRLSTLQTGNPSPLGVVFSFVTPSVELAKQAESTFHTVCKAHRMAGEWFDMPAKVALANLTKCLMAHIGVDLGSDHDSLAVVLEWCGIGRAAELFSSMPDEVSK